MPKKFLLFDHDGVLVDTEYWYFKANQQALSELEIEIDQTQHLELMRTGRSFWDLETVTSIGQAAVVDKRVDRDHYYQSYLKNEDIEIPNVLETLKALSKRYRMAIVTTSKPQDFALIHQDRSIVDYMDFVLTREDYDLAKPHPEPYLAAQDRFGCRKDEALIIEDSERGLRSAVAADIDCAIVKNHFTQTHDFSAATYRIDRLTDLPKLLADGIV